MRERASPSLSSAPTWMIHPLRRGRGGRSRLDGAVLLDGLRLLRLGFGRVGIGHRLRRGRRGAWKPATRRARHCRCHGRPAAAAVRPGPAPASRLGPYGLRFGDFGLATTAARSPRLQRGRRIALVTGGAGCVGPAEASFIGAGLDLNRLDPDRLHRLGRAGDGRDRLGLDHAAGQRRGFGLGLSAWLAQAWPAAAAGLRRRRPSARAWPVRSDRVCGIASRPGSARRQPARRPGPERSAAARRGSASATSALASPGPRSVIAATVRVVGALVEIFGEQVAHDGVARTAAAAAQHDADQMAVAAAHRGHEVEAGGAGVAGLDAVDAFDVAEQAVVVADGVAAIDEGRRSRSSGSSAGSGPGSRGRAWPDRARW